MNELKRRALDEARADAAHERRAATSAFGRGIVRVKSIVAFVRIVLAVPLDATSRRESLLAGVGRDLRYALRRLRRTPTFTSFSVISLAIAIGAATAVYSLVHAVMGPPPGVADPDRVVTVSHAPQGSLPMIGLSWPDYEDLRARQDVFEHLAAWGWLQIAYVANGASETGTGERVTGEYFQTLGVRTVLGRPLQPSDDDPAAPPVAVISHRIWRQMFGVSDRAVGQSIRVNGADYHVVGVVDETFRGLFNGGLVPTSVWLPMGATRHAGFDASGSFDPQARNRRWLLVRGRLAPGKTLEQATAQVAVIARQIDEESPLGEGLDARLRAPYNTGRTWWTVAPLSGRMFGVSESMARRFVAALLVAVGLVLLVACTNLANLSFARATERRHEFSVRRAIGASRFRLVRETLSESLILAGAGGLVSLLVARGLMHVLSAELSINGFILQADPRLDGPVLAWVFVALSLAMVVAGLLPSLLSTRSLQPVAASGTATTVGRWRGRRYLIALQVTVSAMLVALASAFAAQVRQGSAIDTGVDLERLALAEIDFKAQQYDEQQARRFVSEALARVEARPDVESAAILSGLPVSPRNPVASVRTGGSAAFVEFIATTHDVTRTLGLTLVHGRMFDQRDVTGPAVVILSERAATTLFGTNHGLGQMVTVARQKRVGDPEDVSRPRTFTVIGVVSDTDAGAPGQRDHGVAYVPLDQHYEPRLVISARASGDPSRLVDALREVIVSIDPRLAIAQSGTGSVLAGPDVRFQLIVGSAAALLGTFALLLALAGLYGVLAHLVSARTREVGLRIALGATAGRIQRTVMWEGLSPVFLGLIAGLGLAFGVGMGVRATLRGLDLQGDIISLVSIGALFVAAGALACYLPARRASRIDPNQALRSQ